MSVHVSASASRLARSASPASTASNGVIDPLDTRQVLGLALTACGNAPLGEPKFGVFRM